MKIFIFISQKRSNILNDITRKYNLDISIVTTNDFNNFVLTNVGRMEHISHVIVDLFSLVDTDSEILKAIDNLTNIYNDMKIIVLADMLENVESNNYLLSRIVNKEIFDIIKTPYTNHVEFENEFLYCVNVGKTKQDAYLTINVAQALEMNISNDTEGSADSINEAESIITNNTAFAEEESRHQKKEREKIKPDRNFKEYKNHLIISVAGTESHIGTTHNALLITKFLKDIGFKVCYIESGNNNKIFSLRSFYPNMNISEGKNKMQLNRIDMYSDTSVNDLLNEEYDIYVVDVGILSSKNLTSFLYKDVHILVCGGKPWEVAKLPSVLHLIKAKNALNILFNFSILENQPKIINMVGEYKRCSYFTEYVPNLFESNVNINTYKGIFEKYLTVDEHMESGKEQDDVQVVVKGNKGFLNIFSRK